MNRFIVPGIVLISVLGFLYWLGDASEHLMGGSVGLVEMKTHDRTFEDIPPFDHDISDWKVHRDCDLGYETKIPSDYSIVRGNIASPAIYEAKPKRFANQDPISLIVTVGPVDLGIASDRRTVLREAEKRGERLVRLDGEAGYFAKGGSLVLVRDDGEVFRISFTSTTSDSLDAHLVAYEGVYSLFRFIEC